MRDCPKRKTILLSVWCFFLVTDEKALLQNMLSRWPIDRSEIMLSGRKHVRKVWFQIRFSKSMGSNKVF